MYEVDVWKWELHGRETFLAERVPNTQSINHRSRTALCAISVLRNTQHRPCLPVTLTIGITVYILTQTAVKTTMVRLISISYSFSVSQKTQNLAAFSCMCSNIWTFLFLHTHNCWFFLCRVIYLLTFSRDCVHTGRCVYIFFFLTMERRITPLFFSSIKEKYTSCRHGAQILSRSDGEW